MAYLKWWTSTRRCLGRYWLDGVVGATGLAAIAAFVMLIKAHRPISDWLVWDYARIWSFQALFCVGCLSLGSRLLGVLQPLVGSRAERLNLSMTLGVVAFVLAMYLAGALGWYGPVFAVALPVLFSATAVSPILGLLRRAVSRPIRPPRLALSPLSAGLWGFGLVAVLLVYLQCATPDSISYDAAWSHLTIAADYARERRIVPFIAETPKNLPHLASMLYAWNIMLPWQSEQALGWLSAQHTEFVLFLWTLSSTSSAVRWVTGDKGIRAGTWALFFLFPGFFVYDSSMGAGSDHVAAFFAAPLLIAGLRAAKSLKMGSALLTGLFAGALLHTKLQGIYLVAPLALLLTLLWSSTVLRSALGRKTGAAPSTKARLLFPLLGVVGIVLSLGPHLVMNYWFYKNPVYPLVPDLFPGTHPYIADFPVDPMREALDRGPLEDRLLEALRLSALFSFEPQYSFLGKVPFFGSSFTLLTPVLLWFVRTKRLLVVLSLAYGALFLWSFIYPIDRNLQLALPWLVCTTSGGLIVAWRRAHFSRLVLAVLVGLQVLYSIPIYVAGGDGRVQSFLRVMKEQLSPGAGKPWPRYRQSYQELGARLPEDAKLLIHADHLHLGFNRTTLSDWAGWQHVIDYRPMQNSRDLFEQYRKLGITHIFWNGRSYPPSKQVDVLFFAFTTRYAKLQTSAGGFFLWEVPKIAPPQETPYEVATWGLFGYKSGLYKVEQLAVIDFAPEAVRHFPPPEIPWDRLGGAALLARADAFLHNVAIPLDQPTRQVANRCFALRHRYYSGHAVYLRKEAQCPRGTTGKQPIPPKTASPMNH